MRARLVELAAVAAALRDAERRGLVEAPAELRELVASSPYTFGEVDRAFELLSHWDWGALVEPTEIAGASQQFNELITEGLIEAAGDGSWRLTQKGAQMRALLIAYLDPAEPWQASSKRARGRRRERVAERRHRAPSHGGRRRSESVRTPRLRGSSLRAVAG